MQILDLSYLPQLNLLPINVSNPVSRLTILEGESLAHQRSDALTIYNREVHTSYYMSGMSLPLLG